MSRNKTPVLTDWENAQNKLAACAIAMTNTEIEIVAAQRDLDALRVEIQTAEERVKTACKARENARMDLEYALVKLHDSKGGASL